MKVQGVTLAWFTCKPENRPLVVEILNAAFAANTHGWKIKIDRYEQYIPTMKITGNTELEIDAPTNDANGDVSNFIEAKMRDCKLITGDIIVSSAPD